MESPIVIKQEVEEVGAIVTTWVNTKGRCFLCLKSAVKDTKVMQLRSLLRYLQINPREFDDDRNDDGTFGWECDEECKIEVDLCKPCQIVCKSLIIKLEELEKIQMEVNFLLEQTQGSISESAQNPRLVQKLASKMENERGSFNFAFVNNLRNELVKKCKIMQVGRQPMIQLNEAMNGAGELEGNDSIQYNTLLKVGESCNRPQTSAAEGSSSRVDIPIQRETALPGQANEPIQCGAEAVVVDETEPESLVNSSSDGTTMANETAVSGDGAMPSASPTLRRGLRNRKQKVLMDYEYDCAKSANEKSKDRKASTVPTSKGKSKDTKASTVPTSKGKSKDTKASTVPASKGKSKDKIKSIVAASTGPKIRSREGKQLQSGALKPVPRKGKIPCDYVIRKPGTNLLQCTKCEKTSRWQSTMHYHYKVVHMKKGDK